MHLGVLDDNLPVQMRLGQVLGQGSGIKAFTMMHGRRNNLPGGKQSHEIVQTSPQQARPRDRCL